VFLGLGKGMFGSRLDYLAGDTVESITLADLDSDGFPDIVAVLEYSSQIAVLSNQHDGTFGSAVTYATGTTPMSAAAGDIDNDGYMDVVVTARDDSAVTMFLNKSGTRVLDPFWDYEYYACSTVTSVAVGDFDNDGHQDVATAGDACNWVSIWAGTGTG